MLIADGIRELAHKFLQENASDRDISKLKALAGEVEKLENQPSPQFSYIAGWRGACEAIDMHANPQGSAPFRAYEEWCKILEFDMFAKAVSEDAAAMYDIREYPDGPPDGGIAKSAKGVMQTFGSLGDLKPGLAGISLVDPDTKAKMHVPGEFVAPANGSGSPTANVVLQERVANLERDLVALRRDMGERIQELSKAPKKWRA